MKKISKLHEEDFRKRTRRFPEKNKTIFRKDLDEFQATKTTSQQTAGRF